MNGRLPRYREIADALRQRIRSGTLAPGLRSLRHILRYKLGVEIVRARETVSAVRLTGREARELDCRPGSPAFCSERVSFSADRRLVFFDRVYIPGDRFRITRELRYESSRP